MTESSVVLEFIRGAEATVDFYDLLGGDGEPASFADGDVLIWTLKPDFGFPSDILTKTTDDSGITFTDGEDHAHAHVIPDDWDAALPFLRRDLPAVWQLDYMPGGAEELRAPLATGTALIKADVGAEQPDEVAGVMRGPCDAWTTTLAVLADDRCERADGKQFDTLLLSEMIAVSTEILYAATGRLFPGICDDEVYPIVRVPDASRLTVERFAPSIPTDDFQALLRSGRAITLGAYPIVEIAEVKINGEVLDPASYTVLDRRYLVRTDGYAWPIGNDLTGDPDDTTQRTFRVQFSRGRAAPAGGVAASKTYTIELAKAACGDECQLPARVTNIVSQGITVGAAFDPMVFLDKGRTGIYSIDAWIASVNPRGLRRRSGFLSLDRPRTVVRRSS